jgi:protoheme IX farnesyltransferase
MLCIAVGAGAAGAFNMAYDADIDAVMKRTRRRPVPTGRVPASEAYVFAGVMAMASVLLMALATNYVAAGLLAFSIFFYTRDLHHVAEALDAAEYRHRRRRRRLSRR